MSELSQNQSNEMGDLINNLKLYAKDISVIYAEDDPLISKEVVTFLSKFFTDVRSYDNGREAYDAYLERRCDILITDLMMPYKDGFELVSLVKHLRADQKVIAISAHNESENMVKLINIEVDGFLSKPIDGLEMLHTLYEVCKELHANQGR